MRSPARALASIRYWGEPLGRAVKPFKLADEKSLILNYFHLGYENEVILQFLVDYHGITMSLSTQKRRLRDYGLKRRNEVDVDQLRDIIRNEISSSGQALGYRAVRHSLRLVHRIHVPRLLVATILREVDPVGVQQRRRHRLSRRKYFSYGPNFCWHVDGNFRKLFGFMARPSTLWMPIRAQDFSFLICSTIFSLHVLYLICR